MKLEQTDVLIIGAGPSGSSAAALLTQKGYRVLIVEKQYFPRFSIGESLLPQSMLFLEQAGLLQTIQQNADLHAFQLKDGAAFLRGKQRSFYDFTEKFSDGPGTTWQVRRADFDLLLAKQVQRDGVEIRFGHEVIDVNVEPTRPVLTIKNDDSESYQIEAGFLLDASGFGRILPKFLDLELASDFPVRRAVFTHINDGIADDADFDRNKILITVHENDARAWYWLIPFADGRCSFGVVAEQSFFDRFEFDDSTSASLSNLLQRIVADDPSLAHLLQHSQFDDNVRTLVGYSANVKQLAASNYALLGNAGEFLDPVFSSGVTIALKSSSLVAPLVERTLNGESVDWINEYEKPLRKGIKVFRAFVEAWYQGDLQDIVFSNNQSDSVRRMVSSLLAGYVWDETNPLHKKPQHRLKLLADYCRDNQQHVATQ